MTDPFDFETKEQEEAAQLEKLVAKYRHVLLGSEMGIEVLADILGLCHFGMSLDATNQAEIGEHHIGTLILGRLGIFGEDQLTAIVQAMASVTPKEE